MFPVRKLLLFALLSFADFTLTWHLLGTGRHGAYESNPVAAWWLGHFGWLGLAGFKAATMAVAAGLAVLIYRHRPRTGHRVLAFACAAVAGVVLYSGYLCEAMRRHPGGLDPAEGARLAKEGERLDAATQRSLDYREVLLGVVRDVCAHRCTLRAGVTRLAATEQAHDVTWLRHFQVFYPGRSNEECLAVSVINHVELDGAGAPARQLTRDLEAEYHALYGREAPSSFSQQTAWAAPPAGPGKRRALAEHAGVR